MSCTETCIQPSPTQAHCGACHLTWSGVSGFDRHRRDGQCLTPEAIGYADNGSGVYRAPMTEAGRQRLALLRAARTADQPSVVAASYLDGPKPLETLSDGGWRFEPDGNGGWCSAPRHADGSHCWTGPDCIQEHA